MIKGADGASFTPATIPFVHSSPQFPDPVNLFPKIWLRRSVFGAFFSLFISYSFVEMTTLSRRTDIHACIEERIRIVVRIILVSLSCFLLVHPSCFSQNLLWSFDMKSIFTFFPFIWIENSYTNLRLHIVVFPWFFLCVGSLVFHSALF